MTHFISLGSGIRAERLILPKITPQPLSGSDPNSGNTLAILVKTGYIAIKG